jgi:hypothetical protein
MPTLPPCGPRQFPPPRPGKFGSTASQRKSEGSRASVHTPKITLGEYRALREKGRSRGYSDNVRPHLQARRKSASSSSSRGVSHRSFWVTARGSSSEQERPSCSRASERLSTVSSHDWRSKNIVPSAGAIAKTPPSDGVSYLLTMKLPFSGLHPGILKRNRMSIGSSSALYRWSSSEALVVGTRK